MSAMQIIPAIDLKDGKCVRLRQGRMEDDTVFDDDPVAVAERWLEQGARRIHLVDLDGAFAGAPRNADVVNRICKVCGEIPVQIGGGIRTTETARAYLDAGIQWVIVGTLAVKQPEFIDNLCSVFPGHVIVGLDANDGLVATEGWAESSSITAISLAQRFQHAGVSAIVYTDISRDGMMQGVNVPGTTKLAEAVRIPVIASGGVATLADIDTLLIHQNHGITGVIVGRALYEGAIDLAEAQKLADDYAAGQT